MLTTLFFLTLVLLVSVGNLALGFGLAIHLGHGPTGGWLALFGTRTAAAPHDPPPAEAPAATPPKAH